MGTNPSAGLRAAPSSSNQGSTMSQHSHERHAAASMDRVQESVYTASHPNVLRHTAFFKDLAGRQVGPVFDEFRALPPTAQKAVATGTQWLRFSESMTRNLPLATAKLENLEARHFMVQTAFEELGERDVAEIHANRFAEAAELAGVTELDQLRFATFAPVTEGLADLSRGVEQATSDATILGIGLGLEIPAEENIEAVFQGLVHDDVDAEELRRTKFFAVHFQNEPEHIRLSVANYLRFVRGRASQQEFMVGFEIALGFWVRFWTGVTQLAQTSGE